MDKRIERLLALDTSISQEIRIRNEKSPAFFIAGFFAESGDSWLWCGILFVIWLFTFGDWEKIWAFWGGSIALTSLFVFFLKKFIARQRPAGEWGMQYRKGDPYSFPSGHAVRAGLIVVLAWATFGWKGSLVFLVWALIMSLSRVLTGLHYFSDIVAGLVMGIFIGVLWIALQSWIWETFSILFDKARWFIA